MAIYTSKEVNAGGVRVAVRQRLGHGSAMVPEQVAAVVMSARLWLQLAIAALGNGAPLTKVCFQFCFHADPVPERTRIVANILNMIHLGLSRPLGIKVRDMHGERDGYVRQYRGQAHHLGADGQVQWDEADLVQGEIHLDLGMLSKGDDAGRLLIHEAGHKFANLSDHGEHGYHYIFQETRLTWESAKSNADSYAVFTYLMANPHFALSRVAPITGAR
jgi:hypothetical protein